jgi:hypothetical protein
MARTAFLALAAGSALAGFVGARAVPASVQDDHATNQATSFHGAASMDAQLEALAALGLAAEGVTAPAGVDPLIWTASIVPGQEPTAERVALGRELYFDTRLSVDGTVACATCHDVTRGFTDQRPVSEGIDGQLGRRNSPTTMNAALLVEQFWDGRATTVEHQAGMPIVNPIEMGTQTERDVVARIAAVPAYARAFRAAYGRPLNYEDLRVRAHARVPRRAVRPRHERRRRGAVRRGAARSRALRRQGALRLVPPVERFEPARDGQHLPQHRRRGP